MNFIDIEKSIKGKLKQSNVWVPIYQNNFQERDSKSSWFLTFSLSKEKSLASVYWDHLFDTYYGKYKGDIGETKHYLVIKRHGNRKLHHVEIAEDFRLFFNLYEENKEYYIGDYDVEPEKVIRYNSNNDLYEIKFKYLLEYISYKKIYVVLNFELDFYHNDYKQKNKKEKSNNLIFEKRNYLHKSYKDLETYEIMTRYIGKVILDYKSIPENHTEQSVKFISGISNSGKYRYVTINSYYAKNDCDICFSREVLSKYYNRPEIYSVAYSSVSCESYWCLEGINQESFREIVVSTHDLAKLPIKEQEYWSKFSKIAEDVEYNTKEIHETSYLISEFENFQYYWDKKYSTKLFLELSLDNKYKLRQIYVPLTNELSEFFNIVENICICFIETINKTFLRLNTEENFISKDQNGKTFAGTRSTLKDFFNGKQIYADEYDIFLKHLIAIRDNSSHTKSSDYKKAKEYFQIDIIGTQMCIINISKTLREILSKLALCFGIRLY